MKRTVYLLSLVAAVACSHEPTIPAVASQLTLTAPTPSLVIGTREQLTVQVFDQRGAPMSAGGITYTSSDPNVLFVNTSGNVTAVATGTANITASSQGLTATLALSVFASGAH